MRGKNKKSTVAIVKRNKVPGGLTYDYTKEDAKIVKQMVKEAVDLSVGGIDKVVFPGDRVIIKPNILFPVDIKWGICTDPRVVEAIIMLINETVRPVKIYVAENAAMGSPSMPSFTGAGVDIAAARAGAELLPLEKTAVVEVEIPQAKFWIGQNPKIFKPFFDADVVIDVPKIKTHFQTCQVTLGLKNWNGILPFGASRSFTEQQQTGHMVDMDQKLVELHKAVRADLTITDGLIAMEGQGPFAGDLVEMNLILAGSDTTAVDAVTAAVMGFDPLVDIGTIRIAHHEGIGIGDLDSIEVKGKSIAEVKRVFKRPSWDAVGTYPTVEVYGKGGCPGCLAPIRVLIDYMEMMGKIDLVPKGLLKKAGTLIFIEGRGPFPTPDELPKGRVFLIGDCIPEDTMKTYKEKRNATHIPGCAPMHAWIPIAEEVREILGVKEWPSWLAHGWEVG